MAANAEKCSCFFLLESGVVSTWTWHERAIYRKLRTISLQWVQKVWGCLLGHMALWWQEKHRLLHHRHRTGGQEWTRTVTGSSRRWEGALNTTLPYGPHSHQSKAPKRSVVRPGWAGHYQESAMRRSGSKPQIWPRMPWANVKKTLLPNKYIFWLNPLTVCHRHLKLQAIF